MIFFKNYIRKKSLPDLFFQHSVCEFSCFFELTEIPGCAQCHVPGCYLVGSPQGSISRLFVVVRLPS